MKATITPRQLEVLRTLRYAQNSLRRAPTHRQLGAKLGLHRRTVGYHLSKLEEAKLLVKWGHMTRIKFYEITG